MSILIQYKHMKNGKWRLYKSVSQAVTAWRGTNDKITTVREERGSENNFGKILTFASLEEAKEYSKTVLGHNAYEWSDS